MAMNEVVAEEHLSRKLHLISRSSSTKDEIWREGIPAEAGPHELLYTQHFLQT